MKRATLPCGSALLLVMWALILLSAAVLGWAEFIQHDLALHGEANRELDSRAMAHSGIAIGLHPLVTPQTPLLEEELGSELGFKVKLISEGGRLNIKWLLAGEEPRKIEILKRWLEQRDIGFREREAFVDALLDWVDADDVKRLNGVENDDEYVPPNRPLTSLDEIEKVRGAEVLAATPGWKDELTILSQGPVDVAAATPEVLRLIPGFSEPRIVALVQYRQGRDGIDGTIDDVRFKNTEEIRQIIGLSAQQFAELGGLIMVNDPAMRIISEGHSGKVYRQVEVVARKGGVSPQILSWKE